MKRTLPEIAVLLIPFRPISSESQALLIADAFPGMLYEICQQNHELPGILVLLRHEQANCLEDAIQSARDHGFTVDTLDESQKRVRQLFTTSFFSTHVA